MNDSMRTVLVLDDDDMVARTLGRWLHKQGLVVTVAADMQEARDALNAASYDIAFVDLHLPDGHGADLVRWAVAEDRVGLALAMTGLARCETVVRAMQCGAHTVIEKPFDFDELAELLQQHEGPDVSRWRAENAPDIIGESPALVAALDVAARVAPADCTVVIHGESGTGKELFAQALHRGSERKEGPFVAVNCAAIPDALIEDEMFGHGVGAYTGAEGTRLGRVVSADGGTLFLDEIGDMPLAAQAKLLRVLQEGTLSPVGTDEVIEVDVRVVAATHHDLWQLVEQGSFREDLLYRLEVITLELPALRERPEDITRLAEAFIRSACQKTGQTIKSLAESSRRALEAHSWPGNVRELANAIQRAVLMTSDDTIGAKQLRLSPPRRPSSFGRPPAAPGAASASASDPMDLKRALKDKERELIQRALERTQGNRSEAAALLGLNRTTLVEKLKRASS